MTIIKPAKYHKKPGPPVLRGLWLLLLLILPLTAIHGQTEFTDSLMHQGLTRKYIVHLPPGYNNNQQLPMIMALHGGGSGDATGPRDKWHFDEIGDTANFITIFPYGIDNNWADGRGATTSDMAGVDDVSFLTVLRDTLISRFGIDSCRTYLTGASNGGMMALRIANEHPGSFAAYAPMISSMPDSVAFYFNPQQPFSLLLMAGTNDPLVPYGGGALNPITAGGSVVGIDSTIALVLANNGCPGATPGQEALPDLDPTDNSTVVRYDYGICNNATQVVLYKVLGGGHTVPGMVAAINPLPLVGYINYDIDAAVEIWDFFKQHANPGCLLTAINEARLPEDKINIYPNPVKDVLTIQPAGPYLEIEVAIYDLRGQQLLRLENVPEVNLSTLLPGLYLLSVRIDGTVNTVRIVKID